MARRELSPAQWAVVQAVRAALAGVPWPGDILTVRVACSGGADSLALAAGLAWLDTHEPDPLRHSTALVVDHGLQAGSQAVAAGVCQVLQGLGLAAQVAAVTVPTTSPDGLEAAARQARYDALARGDADVVLVGHTLDDQAETVLLGLARGSGTRSLAGMPGSWTMPAEAGDSPSAAAVRFVRPLLGLRRTVTRQACADWGLTPWDDPMNDDPRFARVRARRLLPLLDEALGPGIVEALGRTAALTRADADQLDTEAAALLEGLGADDGLPVSLVASISPALRGRLVRGWLATYGLTELSYERTQAVLALVEDWHGQAGVDLPGNQRVVREAGCLRIKEN